MAGLYLHIPFCRQACYYCDFHFSTDTHHRSELVQALMRELELQKNYTQEPIRIAVLRRRNAFVAHA